MGDIRNFYYDDFPSSQITSAQKDAEMDLALGDLVEIREIESLAHMSA